MDHVLEQKKTSLSIIDLYPHYKSDDPLTFLSPSVLVVDSIHLSDGLAGYLIFSVSLNFDAICLKSELALTLNPILG